MKTFIRRITAAWLAILPAGTAVAQFPGSPNVATGPAGTNIFMPRAATLRRAAVPARPAPARDWRLLWFENRWWYFHPNSTWSYWQNNRWNAWHESAAHTFSDRPMSDADQSAIAGRSR